MANYYARNEYERKLDNQIREAVRGTGDKDKMAMFVQGQETLNLLRRIDDKLKGYPVPDGYMGWLDDHRQYRLFASEADYKDYISEVES